MYGQHTGSSPDGRVGGTPFAPGANPSNGAELNGFVAAGASVARIPFSDCADGISWTVSFAPSSLGRTPEERVDNLASFCDGYMGMGGYHANLNVIDRETLIDADKHPEKYPNLCVRVSGYCVLFHRLTPAQRQDVISRTFHAR
nr:glycine radical domain-containing protein [Ferrigenium kumadai]